MTTLRTIAITAVMAGTLVPAMARADWDEQRIARDHPQILAQPSGQGTTQGMAAGDTRRTTVADTGATATGSNARNERIWADLVRKQSQSP